MPNDVYLDQTSKFVLVNGANGSGKTTILRTLALNVILAQIGCHVPCDKLALTTFNNIFNYSGGCQNKIVTEAAAVNDAQD